MIGNRLNINVVIKSLLSSIALILLCIPVFNMTGSIVKPLIICVVGSSLICLLLTLFNNPERIAGNALLILMIFWLVFAIVKETSLQIEAGFVFDWIYFFYYDKLLMLGTIWLSVSAFFCTRRLIFSKKRNNEYVLFFKTASAAFIIFYTFLLIFSFILIRLQSAEYPFRFQPFATIKGYITDYQSIPYEIFMMFFGNLLYFTPAGYIFSRVLLDKKTVIKVLFNVLFPLITFTLLELSQYIFQNGYCEFDDMMMNTIGFWFGNFLFWCSNKIATTISKGKYDTFWS